MEKVKKRMLIGFSILAVLGASLGIFVYIKKRNNADWKLINLPDGSAKRNRRIILKRPE